MKRKVLLIATLAITILIFTSLAMAVTPSVPNLINFQGRLTDNVGNPVTDGAHTVDFYIYDSRTLGALLWSESQSPTTAGGLFTTQLGLVTPLPVTLFEDWDSLFLEIVADGNLIAPRTLLTATPSARIANALEVPSVFSPFIAGVRTLSSGHHIEIESGIDGFFNQQLGGFSFGETWYTNGAPSHSVNAMLGAYPGSGGRLTLNDDLGGFKIALDGGSLGDASAVLPTDAVNSGEILDEPGIASGYNSLSFIALGTTPIDLDSAVITVPTAGYIVVLATAIDYPQHTSGTRDLSRYTISTLSGALDFAYIATVTTPAIVATDFDMPQHVALHRVDVVGGAGTYRYYFTADEYTGTCMSYQPKITAMFYPTLYGPVDVSPAKPVAGTAAPLSNNPLGYSVETAQTIAVEQITVADHNARLQAARAKQIADLEARIKQLEGRMAGQLPGQDAGTPRKER